MQAARLATRLQRELRMLQSDPPPGVCAWPCDTSLSHLEAQIQGPHGTVYAKGFFKLEIRVPDRYPFEPPSIRFKTPIYHPNIDSGGRICLDILNMPPKGAWKPSLNIPTILASIGVLLAEPNPDDGLMGDITAEYKHDRLSFDMTATKWTQQYAMQKDSADVGDSSRSSVQHDGVQQKTSIFAVEASAQEALSGLETKNILQQEAQTITAENGTKVNKLGKCSVVSSSKLVLGAKLSLEKGCKDSGKESRINTADADITSKRALACIDNTVGTRQVIAEQSQSSETSFEKTKVKGMGNSTTLTAKLNDHLTSAPCAEGGQTKGIPDTPKTMSAGTSIDLGKSKRPRECKSVTPPTDSAPMIWKQQTGCPDNSRPSETGTSVSHTISSVTPAAKSECLAKASKYFSSSCKASKHPSGDSAELYLKRDEANNLESDSAKSRICIARPVRISLTCNPVDGISVSEKVQVRPSHHAAASTVRKESVEISEKGQTSSVSSVPISTKKGVPAFTQDDNSERSGEPRREAGHLKNAHTPLEGSDSDSYKKVHRRFAATPVVQDCAPPMILASNALLARAVADHTSTASGLIRSSVEPQSKCLQGTNVGTALITGESTPGDKGSISAVDRLDMARKPPKPSKPATNIIVLDSESDEEPPKGRSRLSLSRRRVKNKTKY